MNHLCVKIAISFEKCIMMYKIKLLRNANKTTLFTPELIQDTNVSF